MSLSNSKEERLQAELEEQKALIADLKNREEGLVQENRYLRELFERSPLGYQSLDENGCLLEMNKAWLDILGYSKEEVIGQNFGNFLAPDWQNQFKTNFPQLKAVGEILGFEFEMIKKDGSILPVNLDGRVGKNAKGEFQQTYCIIKDITRQKEAENTQKKLQTELLQAQKMESIGRLAGGIAHDFNNMLTAIIGHAELAKIQCKPEEVIYSRLEGIENAAHRSAALVSQLLAFARKQAVAPKTISLNQCVTRVWDMLVRIIGEDIQLENRPAGDIWPVTIDPSQVDQILTNLCVNARDAIVGVGTIVIETKNVIFESDYGSGNSHVKPRKYVQLSVSDDGAGMENSTLEQIFEPFYTTKEKGKGTGLGLSSVYGIVQQNNGFVNVYSEPDIGTTFKVFLPYHSAEAVEQVQNEPDIPKGNAENILFVEDEIEILKVGKEVLSELGYNVIPALSAKEAIEIVQNQAGKIDLLITDVVMPEMNGRELAHQVKDILPSIKCLFISGYTEDVIAHHGILDSSINFLQKPFSSKDIAIAVNHVLVDC